MTPAETSERSASGSPIIVTALFGNEDFAWLDGLRRRYFPPEHYAVPAHLTLFHHLPPALAGEVKRRLVAETRYSARPRARVGAVTLFDRGVALRVASPQLDDIRARLAAAFDRMLTPRDRLGWRGHVTIQNKVSRGEAKTLHAELSSTFEARSITITGLAGWWYCGGPWQPLSRHMFAR